jgi:protoporphyrinogen oxidase
MPKQAIIIGAGPAGLTAAYELLKRTDIIPVILEKSGEIGGISKTVRYKGNRMDIGGHRFFSKSDRVMKWWLNILPLAGNPGESVTIRYQQKSHEVKPENGFPKTGESKGGDKVMLVRKRLSRIYFLRKFFSYPLQLSVDTVKKLGYGRTIGILISYLAARVFPRRPERNLEDFFINRFGKKLYQLFFKEYTEKVWGVPCTQISPEWGAQRIKGISIAKALSHAVNTLKPGKASDADDISQKSVETSMIEQFFYPKFGPGQLWEEVARQVQDMGGEVHLNQHVKTIYTVGSEICSVHSVDSLTGELRLFRGDYFFSTMPVQELIAAIDSPVPANVKEVAAGLQYRDFITVGVLLKKGSTALPDTWIYIQERDVKVGRLQVFNNWSPFMVKDPDTVWLGMEYFCDVKDAFWNQSDAAIQSIAIGELVKMGLARTEDVLDSTVLRMEKTYPAYFGTYGRFDEIRRFADGFENLFLVGRNGMHKYNNSDHSMLTAMVAVDNICLGLTEKSNIWNINTEQEYHEEKTAVTDGRKSLPDVQPSLIDYVWRNKWNRGYLLFACCAILLQLILFKSRYPFANYMPDSYSYLAAASSNADVNMWPVAYSKFLRLVSVFTHSDTMLVSIQYLFLQVSTLLFFYTICYFWRPGAAVRNGLYVFFLFNPISLYISNYIAADTLFIGISLLWLTQLFWIIYRPRPYHIFLQAVLLSAAFAVRYNAIYYPLIAAVAFILTRKSWSFKIAGIALGAGLVIASIFFTSYKMQEVTGQRQFSAFGGWQMANNALYMYKKVPASERQPVPQRFAKLEGMVRQHIDTISRLRIIDADPDGTNFYLWSKQGPLIQYMSRQWKDNNEAPYFVKWASEGPLYADYGLYLIRKHPVDFAKIFLLQNAVRFAVPPVEFIGAYNMGLDTVRPLAKDWFNYKSVRVSNYKKDHILNTIRRYPILAALINCCFIISCVGFLIFGGIRRAKNDFSRILLVVGVFWLLNAGFSIFASPLVLRYQVFPVMISLALSLFLLEFIIKTDNSAILKANDLAHTTIA